MRVPPTRPYVLINMAMTADGKIATANHAVESFSSQRDFENLLRLRTTADAVMCGASTANASGVTLEVGGPRFQRARRRRGLAEFHLRIIVSGHASVRPDAGIFRSSGGPILIFTGRDAPKRRVEALRRVAQSVTQWGDKEVDLAAALEWLRHEWKVQRLVCEGGGALNDAMIRAGLVDELHLTICPKIFGGREAPTIAEGHGVPSLSQAARWVLHRARRVGDEHFLIYHRREKGHEQKVP